MVYIGSEAKWRLYYEGGVKKILALAGAKGRHKNMFSAVISTAATQLVGVKGNEAKKNKQNTPNLCRFACTPRRLTSELFRVLYGYYLGGRVQYYSNVC